MSYINQQDKMRWILFWVFIVAFCVLTIGTILLLFMGLGTVNEAERSFLVKIFVGEVGFAVIVLFYSLFELKKSKLMQKQEKITVEASLFFLKTYPRSQHPVFFSEVEKLVPKAKKIILIATGLNLIWEKHIADLLINRARSGEAEVTICLGNPFSPHVENRLIEEEMQENRPPVGRDGIKRNIKALCQRIILAGNPQGISVLLFEHYPTFATLIFDGDIFIYPYAYQILGNSSPIFHLKNDGSNEAQFFVSNAARILRDAIPAKDLVATHLSRKYCSDNWITAAVYLIPDQKQPLYQFGSSILGYDIRQEILLDAGDNNTLDVSAYVGEAKKYGFHATLADALFFATQSEIDRIKAELRILTEDFPPFKLSNFKITNNFREKGEIVLLCDDESGITEVLHHELVSRVYRTAISSTFLTGRTQKKAYLNKPERSKLMMQRYGAPYILNEFVLHFTLCSSAPTDAAIMKQILNKLHTSFTETVNLEKVEIDEICLVGNRKGEERWKILEKYPLCGK